MSIADNPIFHDKEAAREWLEALLWPDGPVCPHCGLIGAAYKMRNTSQRPGVYECKGCAEQFTVTVGTVCERSHIPLNKWVLAFHLVVASKKGMSANQMGRMLGLTYKSAWFMCHRIRAALMTGGFPVKLGGSNKVVEIDETYVGGKTRQAQRFFATHGEVVSVSVKQGLPDYVMVAFATAQGQRLGPLALNPVVVARLRLLLGPPTSDQSSATD